MKNKFSQKIILIFLVTALINFCAIAGSPQQETGLTDDLYLKALNAYLNEASRKYAGIATVRDYNNLVIEKNDAIATSLPTSFGSHRIFYQTREELIERSKKMGDRIPITVLQPMKNAGNKIVINFSEYWFSSSPQSSLYALEGGCSVTFIYDCAKQAFIVEKVNLWGV